MKLTFLGAERPLTKQYSLDSQNKLQKISAPMVYDVTSYEVEVFNIIDMHAAIAAAANRGWCLLKGNPNRPLINESRAGSTDPNEETYWACIDSDGSPYATADELMAALGMPDVSYVLQWSSSHGIETRSGLRCHIFVLFSTATTPAFLKRWLYTANLTVQRLSECIRLTASSCGLTFPLDISTCQNDKLVYISPPQLGPGLSDPIPERIELVKKTNDFADLDHLQRATWTEPQIRTKKEERIKELRTAAGLDNRKSLTEVRNGVEFARAVTGAESWDVREARGFVYFNLNGGDSWAYYHPVDNPTYIYNFKGEPVYRTVDILPEYWRQLQQHVKQATPNAGGSVVLGFIDRSSGSYYIAELVANNLFLLPKLSEKQLRDGIMLRGMAPPDIIPEWDIVWDPTSNLVFDPAKQVLNTFKPSEVMGREAPGTWDDIRGVMLHALGGSEEALEAHLDWLALIYQTRESAKTAWVLHGTQGTGKGLLYSEVYTRLLGPDNVSKVTTDHIDAGWTDWIENKLLVVVDEMDIESSRQAETAMAQLKLFITEPTISSRQKFKGSKTVPNRASLMFFSNQQHSVSLGAGDRRFNVAPRQESSIAAPSSHTIMNIRSQVPALASFLLQRKIDPMQVARPLQNDARQTLAELSMTAAELLTKTLLSGDLTELAAYISSIPSHLLLTKEGAARQATNELITSIVLSERTTLSREELGTLYEGLVGNVPQSPNKLASYLRHNGIEVKPVRLDGKLIRGVTFTWKKTPELHSAQQCLESAASPLKIKRAL